jgi:ABC-type molybdate transport system permease subunit
MAPIARMRLLWMGIAVFFALVAPLELEAPTTTLELNAPVGTHVVVVAAAVGCAMVFLLCFNGLAEATIAADSHFGLAFPCEGATFAASIFFFPTAFSHLLGLFQWRQVSFSSQPW